MAEEMTTVSYIEKGTTELEKGYLIIFTRFNHYYFLEG